MGGDKYETGSGIDCRQETEVDTRCGYGSCKPGCLQVFNKARVLLLFVSIMTFVQGFAVNGVNNVNTQALERRFHLPSSKSSLVAASYDFSAAVFGFVLSFLGSGRYKARWLAAGSLVLGLGSFIMTVPHFATGLYVYEASDAFKTCNNGTSIPEYCESEDLGKYLGVLILGMVLHGVGGGILYTIGIGVLDDSVDARSSPVYLGVFYGAATLGPGVGYVVGGEFLNYYVDFDKVDQDTISLSREDPRWIGAWWLAFFITMALFFIAALPLSCFGAELPSAQKVRNTRTSQQHKGKSSYVTSGNRFSIRELPRAIIKLFKNPVFTCAMIAGTFESMIITGFSTFAPKFVQNHFNISSGAAAIYTGAVTIPGAAGGMLVGGLICRWMKLKVPGMIKLCLVSTVLAAVFASLLWLKCEDANIAGVNTPYAEESTISIESTCNSHCGCSTRFYDAVCHDGNVQYFSACHAGCSSLDDDGKTFTNCTCLDVASNVTMVTEGRCNSGCKELIAFFVLLFFSLFFSFMPTVPSESAILRSIPDDYRTFSMGLERVIGRLLGTVPGPIVFGALTDVACTVWETECGEESSCWIYDNFQVSRNYFVLTICLKAASFVFFFLALCLYKPPANSAADEDQRKNTDGGKENRAYQGALTDSSDFPPGYVRHRESTQL